MKLLVIGGTEFVGRHVVEAALAAGHEVTLFNRGRTNPRLFPEVEHLHGDRETIEGLGILQGRSWHAVLDTCAYVPRVARMSAERLAGSAEHYTFISTCSVYPDERTTGLDETAPLAGSDDPESEEVTGESYGPLKALCEREVQRVFADRALVIRPGYIVGPHDPTDRFTYWPRRAARGGEMLVPALDYRMQVIDVRDLGEWCVRLIEGRVSDVFNAVGPLDELTLGEVIAAAAHHSGSDIQPVEADVGWLLAHGVDDDQFPLWHPRTEEAGVMAFSVSKAVAAGLSYRTIQQTVADTLAWDATLPEERELAAGMTPEREAPLLEALRSRSV